MYIQHITIENFGAISAYDTDLTRELNFLESYDADEIATAIGFVLCNKTNSAIPEQWLQEDTRISAKVNLPDTTYWVQAEPQQGQLQLLATDPDGADATARYQYALTHCPEQDAMETFNGQDREIPLRLSRYLSREADDLSTRTRRIADTKLFHRYLYQYIRNFRPEPINSQKQYLTAIDSQGIFAACYPGLPGKANISETEEKLFRYTCFLNIAEFWAGFGAIRDLHHKKKPLLIRNFVEYLDASTDIGGLLNRTKKLKRQILLFTSPLDEESKQKWIGERNGSCFGG